MTSVDPPDLALAFPEIIAHYKQFVDRAQLRENLKLTPAQRAVKFQAVINALEPNDDAG